MPEYKELERSLLARMFRTGVIDAATFISRTEALGYDPGDVLLMVQLEKSDAVKSTLWQGIPDPAEFDLTPNQTVESVSPDLDITGVSYIRVFSNISYIGWRMIQIQNKLYNSAGTQVQIVSGENSENARFEDMSFEPDPSAVTLKVVLVQRNTKSEDIHVRTPQTTVEVVIL